MEFSLQKTRTGVKDHPDFGVIYYDLPSLESATFFWSAHRNICTFVGPATLDVNHLVPWSRITHQSL